MQRSAARRFRANRSRPCRRAIRSCEVLLWVTTLISLVALAGHRVWFLFYPDQPRLHYALLLTVGLIVCLLARRLATASVAGVGLVVNLAVLAPVLFPHRIDADTAAASAPAALTTLHANVDRQERLAPALTDYITHRRADVIALQEVTPTLLDDARARLVDYGVLVSAPRRDTRGVAMFARRRLPAGCRVIDAAIRFLAGPHADRPHAEAVVMVGSRPMRFLSYHCVRPSGVARTALHAQEYAALADWFAAGAGASFAMGDFNAAPWSRRMGALIDAGGLPNAQQAFSITPTWPGGAWHLGGVPIDLCVHDARTLILEVEVGPNIGSDHRPLLCRVTPAGPLGAP